MMNRRQFLTTTAGISLLPFVDAFAASRKIRFAVASDGHFGQPNTPFQQYFDEMIVNIKAEKAKNGLDFVVFNGDLFHDDIKFLPQVKQNFDRLEMPYYVTRGNHDHVPDDVWQSTWGYALNSVVDLGRFGIVLADTSNIKGEYLCPNVIWLDQELAKMNKKKAVFLFLHIPSNQWSKHGTSCDDFFKVLAKYPNVKAMFHGHDHAIDDVKPQTPVPAIFDGHFGGNWGTNYRGFRIVNVEPNGDWHTYQFDPAKNLKINQQ